MGISADSSIAASRVMTMVVSILDSDSATPPLKPMASNRYRDRNFAICAGISRSERAITAAPPRKKNNRGGDARLLRKPSMI